MKYLLTFNEDIVNLKDLSNVSPLFLATYTGNAGLVELLLEKGADPEVSSTARASPLHICAERGFVEIAQMLLKFCPQIIWMEDSAGNLALHVASDWDQIHLVKLICNSARGEELERI